MALKGDRYIETTEIAYFMDEVAERGGIVCSKTYGSGAALDQGSQLATYPANSSGQSPIGVLLCDMVNIDLTRYKLNQHRDEVQKGGKVSIMRKGWVRTNFGAGTITAGPSYLTSSGYVTSVNGGAAATPLVGKIDANPDEDGYFKHIVNLP